MNDISIHIDTLGPIKNAKIDIRPLMLFTGESGLGKSYLACLANYTYAVLAFGNSRLMEFFNNIDFTKLLEGKKSGHVIYTLQVSELFEWINNDAINYISYMVGNPALTGKIDIKWPFDEEQIVFTYHELINGLDNHEQVVYRISSKNFKYNTDEHSVEPTVFTSLTQAELLKSIYNFKTLKFIRNYILPPSRGALMDVLNKPVFHSGMYDAFFKLKADLARPVESKKETDPILSNLLLKANDGSISKNEDKFLYTMTSGVQIPLSAAASSIKELAPLALLLPKYELEDISLLLEEPEAHLHPSRQQFIADLIGYMVSKGCQLQITTHSDYFIKRINSLIKLYPLVKELSSEEAAALLGKHGFIAESLIDAKKVIAYNLSRDMDGNTIVSLLDTDVDDGVPFDSFHNVITRYFDLLNDLSLIKDKDSEL